MPQFLETSNLYAIGHALLRIVAILATARVGLAVGNALIGRALKQAPPRGDGYERRALTLAAILRSALRYAVNLLALLLLLQPFLDIRPLLAGAGVLGLAIGFGAQNLIRDVISGFFVIFEDQFAVGDYITVGEAAGLVEEVGLRITRLRDSGGQLHIIPNGRIERVTNHSRGPQRAQVDITIARQENLERALESLEQACRKTAAALPGQVKEGPKVLGVVDLRPAEVQIRLVASVTPLTQGEVERELRRRAKESLDRQGGK